MSKARNEVYLKILLSIYNEKRIVKLSKGLHMKKQVRHCDLASK
jgi:hypothetical protein